MKHLFLLLLLHSARGQGCWDDHQASHQPSPLSSRLVKYVSECLDPGEQVMEDLLDPLLITRIPGSPGSKAARDHIISELNDLNWTMELDTFTSDTVVGTRIFTNIVATLHPNSPRHLVVAAHYDTKVSPKGFIGAIDSAVPCAMMLHLAKSLTPTLTNSSSVPELSLQLIFFDGEEAFKSWTSTDSLYGSRHLADLLQSTSYQVPPDIDFCQTSTGSTTQLDRIDSFILLDLLGSSQPTFRRYTQFNTDFYDVASQIEQQLTTNCYDENVKKMFTDQNIGYMVQDDHVPFYQKGVRKILHMIASPFPRVWHTLADNEEALDMETIGRLNKLLRLIVYSYLMG